MTGLSSSLVEIRTTVAPRERCPRRLGWVLVSRSSGLVVPASCKANTCPHCGPLNARAVAGAVALASPERFGTLTMAGDTWQVVRGRLKRLQHRIRASVPESRWCWHVEPNPAGTGQHVHFWQRGGFIPQQALTNLAKREGMGGVTDIRRWKLKPGTAVGYGVKLTGVFYGLKTSEAEGGMSTYLAANGGRLVHASRGWWRDRQGVTCTQRAAMRSWAEVGQGDDPGPWELAPEGTAGVLGVLLSGTPGTALDVGRHRLPTVAGDIP